MMKHNQTPLYKLPKHVIPEHYKINIKPDFSSSRRFGACLEVRAQVTEASSEIILNVAKLNLKKVEFRVDNGLVFKPQNIFYDAENELVKLLFDPNLAFPIGSGIIYIEYDGELHDCDLNGMYVNVWNHLKEIMMQFDGAQTHLEVPCWKDQHHQQQPFQVTFRLEIELPEDFDVIFNSVIEKVEKIKDGWKKVTFKDTPVMSPWSLAWTFGKLDQAIEKTVSGTKLCFSTSKSYDDLDRKKHWANWAVEISSKIWHYFTITFGHGDARYPFEKLDFVAVPSYAEIETGHLGLIQIGEDRFWINEDHLPHAQKQKVALELTKQITNQWIGNLVTIQDWKQIWLEESFSKFLKYHIVDKIWPEWSVWDQEFTREELMPSMHFDMSPTTNESSAITKTPLNSWTGITSFDYLEHFKSGDLEKFSHFSKGVAVLRMLKSWIGELIFEKAIINFFSKNGFNWTTTECFWTELERQSMQPIKQIMNTWFEKKSFPLVQVISNVDSVTGNLTITIKQEPVCKYFNNLESLSTTELIGTFGEQDEPNWWIIPFSITTDPKGLKPKIPVLLNKEQISIIIPASEYRNSVGYFKIDPKHTCYMIVNYAEDYLRQVMIPAIQRCEIYDSMDRFGLLFDVHMLAKIGIYSTVFLFSWIKANAVAGENDFAIWRMMERTMEQIRDVTWEKDNLAKIYEKCRFETDFFEEFLTNFGENKLAFEVCKWVLEKVETKYCARMSKQAIEYAQMEKQWAKREKEQMQVLMEKFH